MLLYLLRVGAKLGGCVDMTSQAGQVPDRIMVQPVCCRLCLFLTSLRPEARVSDSSGLGTYVFVVIHVIFSPFYFVMFFSSIYYPSRGPGGTACSRFSVLPALLFNSHGEISHAPSPFWLCPLPQSPGC